ncbi:hypothetical protein LQ938_09360 [Microbacterium sp. cx-55]|uniref:hypothetical protein n=1 Tax=Microbacterium sp. cx-55 TaxID=2875948 RepID=UPI001CC1AB1D|nr:hypothetical protein [Microbacterium sp. cx-55]MBZ4486031.1 hypothetical protein [Microbacterium sp. cx-55]UGB34097.1 hypothetical protein LQ938_09360 [Microbacterium sp. cx-55]
MRAHRRYTALLLIAAGTAVLTGCQPGASTTPMQTFVVDTADQIAAGDTAAAASTLDALDAEVSRALAAGEIDAAEADRIRAAIAVLRADLAALTSDDAGTTDPDVTPVQTTDPEETTDPDDAVDTPAPVVTPSEESDDSDDAPGNSGNAPGNGGTAPGNDKPDKDKSGKNDGQ